MQRIEALLRKEIGLDAASIGSSLIERTIRLRMKHHGHKRSDEYEQMLRQSQEEFNELIEAVAPLKDLRDFVETYAGTGAGDH